MPSGTCDAVRAALVRSAEGIAATRKRQVRQMGAAAVTLFPGVRGSAPAKASNCPPVGERTVSVGTTSGGE